MKTVINDVAVCPDGRVVASRATNASNSPVSAGAFDTTYNYTVPSDDNSRDEGFVAKFDAAGMLKFLTCLDGSTSDRIAAVAVDKKCSIYLTGQKWSGEFRISCQTW